MSFLIGQGFDIHRFAAGRELVLGGVTIPSEFGLEGHSDADVILHAVCDAILGALGAGDIGEHFPNTDDRWRGCRSEVFVAHCVNMMRDKDYSVANVDVTVLAERPKLSAHKTQITASIASMLGVAAERVGVKATTMEQLGAIGRGEGMAAMAIVLLQRTSP